MDPRYTDVAALSGVPQLDRVPAEDSPGAGLAAPAPVPFGTLAGDVLDRMTTKAERVGYVRARGLEVTEGHGFSAEDILDRMFVGQYGDLDPRPPAEPRVSLPGVEDDSDEEASPDLDTFSARKAILFDPVLAYSVPTFEPEE